MSILYKRIEELCEEKGITGYRLCKDVGMSPNVMTELKKGRRDGLSAKNANKVAEYFGVTVAYLLGTEEKPATNEGSGLSEEAIEFGRIFDAAAPEIKERMKDAVEGKATIRTAINVVNVKCPLDGSMQKIYQNVIKVDGKVFPNTINNGCEMYHPCQECEVCRMRAMFAELKGFSK